MEGCDKSVHVPLHTQALHLDRLSSEALHHEALHPEHSLGQGGEGVTKAFMLPCTQALHLDRLSSEALHPEHSLRV